MYKTQLKRWKLFKNNRVADVAAILRSQCRRTAVRNGRRVDTHTYLRRKGVSADEILRLAPADVLARPPSPMQGVLLGLAATPGGLGTKEIVGGWLLRECERLEEQMAMAMVIDSGIECEPVEKDRPLLIYCESTASKLAAEYYDAIWLLQKSQRDQGWALANAVFERLHTMLDESEHLLYPVLNLLMIILALPPGADTAAATAMADIHRALWDYLSSYARIRFGADHAVHHVLGQLSELFSQQKQPDYNTRVDGDGDDRYDLLYSIVSDVVDALGAKKDESGKQTMYYDIVSLWYAETLQSHRGHRKHGYRPRLHLGEDEMLTLLEAGRAAGAGTGPGAASLSSSSSFPGRRQQQQHGHPAHVMDPDTENLDLGLVNDPDLPDLDLDLAAVQSYLLLDLGWQTSWRDPAVRDSCAVLLHAKRRAGAPPDETEVNCLTAMALYEWAQCVASSPCTSPGLAQQQQQHHAAWLLSEAVSLDWDLSGASIYNFEGLLLLQEWCADAGDWAGLEAVRRRSRECLDILFGEWGV
ncbi:hypothetical protein BJ166DRAFT_519104 [Pestalotiopsis sp. NC0098]|nr:hypothetical protein BJ166DRAFT_519104 [Pestalotiopsis sp. NC0098]